MQTQTPTDRAPLKGAPPALIPARRSGDVHDGELLPPRDQSLELIAAPNPFGTRVIRRRVTAGQTIAEMIEAVQPVAEMRRSAHVWLVRYGDYPDSIFVPAENWHRVRPKPGTTVTVRVAPAHGGGSGNPLRIVMAIAVLAASVWIGSLPAVAALGSVGAAAVQVGVASSGALLVSSRKPPPLIR